MKNNKGFTLVELIVVVGLLALFGASIGISLTNMIKGQKENDYETYVNKVKSAANLYASGNSEILEELYTDKGYIKITVEELLESGLIDENTINPETNEPVNPEDYIKISLGSDGTIKIEYPYEEVEEDYLQTMDIVVEIRNPEELCYKGINSDGLRYIKKDGSLGTLTKDSNIKCDDKNVDINKLGTYELKYEYLIEQDKWKQATRNVIVVDTKVPDINSFTKEANTTSATLTGKAIDSGSGILYYYFGTENNLTNISNKGTKITPTISEITKSITVTSSGTYYFYVQDQAGNIAKKSAAVTIETGTTSASTRQTKIMYLCRNNSQHNAISGDPILFVSWHSLYSPESSSSYDVIYKDVIAVGKNNPILVYTDTFNYKANTDGKIKNYTMYELCINNGTTAADNTFNKMYHLNTSDGYTFWSDKPSRTQKYFIKDKCLTDTQTTIDCDAVCAG